VRATGRYLRLSDHPWLEGPVGGTRRIGSSFFVEHADRNGYELIQTGTRGLIPSFNALERNCDLSTVAKPVRDFYERTSEFDLDAWSEWHGFFKPFGRALSVLFGRRLQQLNIPLSSLDSSKGMTSSVVQVRDSRTHEFLHTAWVRELHATGNVLYAGAYSISNVPEHSSPCVKVVFPLPNGNAIVLMETIAHPDGSLTLRSAGDSFGCPGFYFVVHEGNGNVWARYVKSLKEEIHVYQAESGIVRANHRLWFCGIEFLRLHYRMQQRD
jgi:hypothetical protein